MRGEPGEAHGTQGALGRREEALGAAERAVAIHDRLAHPRCGTKPSATNWASS
jgi:hypothetical protein